MEIGFTLWQCVNEKIENSDSANAGNIKITLHDRKLAIADDGVGMNGETARDKCGQFHERSSSSANKHVRKVSVEISQISIYLVLGALSIVLNRHRRQKR